MFQLSSGLNFKSVLNFIHTFSTIQDQIVNCLFQIIAIEKSSLIVLVHSLSFVFFVHVSDAILYWMLYLYTGTSIFDLIIFLFLVLVLLFSSLCLCLSHFLLRRRARVLRTHFLSSFLYLNVHTFLDT